MSTEPTTDGAAGSPSLHRGGAPLYAQVRDGLQRQIERHDLPPGSQLPTEEELTAAYGVSRSVVRQALGDLAALGLVDRRRGRGTVVLPRSSHRRRASQAGGLRQQVAAAGGDLRTAVLSLDEVPAEAVPGAAERALATDRLWRLERLRSVGGEPVQLIRTWLPRTVFTEVDAAALVDGSLHEWMRTTGNEPAGGPRQIRAVPADATVAAHLGVEQGTPLLLLEGVTCDADGRGLEWFAGWHAPGTVFDVDAEVGPPGAVPPSVPATDPDDPDELARLRALVADLRRLLA